MELTFGTAPLGAVVVTLYLNYIKPVRWDPVAQVIVRTALDTTTPYSFSLRQNVECAEGSIRASGEIRLALVDRETRRIHRVDLSRLRTDEIRMT